MMDDHEREQVLHASLHFENHPWLLLFHQHTAIYHMLQIINNLERERKEQESTFIISCTKHTSLSLIRNILIEKRMVQRQTE
jgi:hypothetical protein